MPGETTATRDETAERFRRPVGMSVDNAGMPVVVCSDGSVWAGVDGGEEMTWGELPPIPGSWRAKRWGTE
jgi:hypothetical protein